MEIIEREDYLSISKEEVLARVDSKIKGFRKNWIKSIVQEDFIEYDKVRIKEDTISITRAYKSRQPSGGIFIRLEHHPKGVLLKSKIYIDTSLSKFFRYFFGSIALLVSVLFQLWEFSIAGIFLTLLIELGIFIYTAIIDREAMNDLEFYYQRFIKEIERS